MNKMNKKGFTLIEMLVVIAIIAVLVSIIIPTVSSATDKAGAATNAANLRSVVAEATTKMLSSDASATGNVQLTFSSGKVSAIAVRDNAPYSAKTGSVDKDTPITLTYDDVNGFQAYYGTYSLTEFAKVAGGDIAASEMTETTIDNTVAGFVTGTGKAK